MPRIGSNGHEWVPFYLREEKSFLDTNCTHYTNERKAGGRAYGRVDTRFWNGEASKDSGQVFGLEEKIVRHELTLINTDKKVINHRDTEDTERRPGSLKGNMEKRKRGKPP